MTVAICGWILPGVLVGKTIESHRANEAVLGRSLDALVGSASLRSNAPFIVSWSPYQNLSSCQSQLGLSSDIFFRTTDLRAFFLNTSGSATSGTIKAQIPSPDKLRTSALLQLPDCRPASTRGITKRQDTRPMAAATVPLKSRLVAGRVSIQEISLSAAGGGRGRPQWHPRRGPPGGGRGS
jgi:hypothetical protein